MHNALFFHLREKELRVGVLCRGWQTLVPWEAEWEAEMKIVRVITTAIKLQPIFYDADIISPEIMSYKYSLFVMVFILPSVVQQTKVKNLLRVTTGILMTLQYFIKILKHNNYTIITTLNIHRQVAMMLIYWQTRCIT